LITYPERKLLIGAVTQPPSPHIELVSASREQEPVIANLLQLYIYDFSELLDLDTGADAKFDYPHLPLYWSEPGRHPFLVNVDGRLAGFVLVKAGSKPASHDMAEFFVLRRYRRHGVGTSIAHQVWRRLPGPWEVRVMEANVAARYFWAHAISSFTGLPAVPTRVERDAEIWQLFSFESRSE
jgi:predicted acetyltransferase